MLAIVTRDGVAESVHRGHVAVADAEGVVHARLGVPDEPTYPRSALKPLQAVATQAVLAEAGAALDVRGVAIASASHEASVDQQIEVAYVLALAGLDERFLRCPSARPADARALDEDASPTTLAHNCSGKHAAFLYAHTASGGEPGGYLDASAALQRRVAEVVARTCGAEPQGPAVDGCGAPAWRLPLTALATGFARLAAGADRGLAQVRDAMLTHPRLVGGRSAADTAMMRAERGVVAKRGAEGVLAAGWVSPHGPRGVAVKIADGAPRAAGPVAGTVLTSLGATMPEDLLAPAVLAGGAPHGSIAVATEVRELRVT